MKKLAAFMVLAMISLSVFAQGTAFTYHGSLIAGGVPANGSYDLQFTVYDSTNLPGVVIAGPIATNATSVSNGLFVVTLDFGNNVFTGPARWLQIGVKTNGGASFTTLTPRQAITATPYAIFSGTSSNVISGSVVKSFNGLKDDVTLTAGANVTITPSGNTLSIASTGGVGSDVWSLNGSSAYYNNGRVGIGTNTPAATLDLEGINGNALLYLTAGRPTVFFRDTFTPGSFAGVGSSDGNLRFYPSSFESGVNPNAAMAFTTNGFLGIGTFTPSSGLHITGLTDAVKLTGAHPFLTLDDTAAGLYSRIHANGAGLTLETEGAADGNNPGGVIALTGVGNVGLGTTNPTSHLTVLNYPGGPTWTANGWISGIELDNASAIGWRANAAGNRFGIGHSGGGLYMFHTASDPGTTGSSAIADLTIDDSGRVGIGTTAPSSKVEIAAQDALKITGYQPLMTFRDSNAGNARGVIQSVSGGLNFFTESYQSGANANNYMALDNTGNFTVKNITIRGGADVAEPFEFSNEHLSAGSVVVIDDEHPGKLKLSSRAYDTRVAGIISGANGVNPGLRLHQEGLLDGSADVALTGRVYVLADASKGAIRPGDLLTTSDTPGHAMKVTDHLKAQGAILGKAMTELKTGKGMVLVLVTLQ